MVSPQRSGEIPIPHSMKVEVWIGVGGNLPGTPRAIRQALDRLSAFLLHIRISRWLRTPPWGHPYQPPFWNLVVRGWTYRSPAEVMDFLTATEREIGRRREERWGPRILDLDLLLYGDRVIRRPDLLVPHPWLSRRAFVLVPAGELGNPLHPCSGQTLRWHRDHLDP